MLLSPSARRTAFSPPHLTGIPSWNFPDIMKYTPCSGRTPRSKGSPNPLQAVEKTALRPGLLCLHKQHADRLGDAYWLPRRRKFSGLLIHLEENHRVRALIRREQVFARRIQREVTRRFALGQGVL